MKTKNSTENEITSISNLRSDVVSRVEKLIITHSLFTGHESVIVAVSGGSDSMALLHILHRVNFPINLAAVYVDHGLRPDETGAEIDVVRRQCRSLSIPFEVLARDVASIRKKNRMSLEEAARFARYEALESARKHHGASKIAVGHTADDQAEEILLRLVRGSGRKGLSGMAIRRGSIIRPLLHEKKQSLIDFLHNLGVPFCQDSSNLSQVFLRNKVRLDLLPHLEQNFNVSIRDTLTRTAAILCEEEDLLEQMAENAFRHLVATRMESGQECEVRPQSVKIVIGDFLSCHPAIQRRVAEKICWLMQNRPTFMQIEKIRELAEFGENGSEIHLRHGFRVWKTSKELIFSYPSGKQSHRGRSVHENKIFFTAPAVGTYLVSDHSLKIEISSDKPVAFSENELIVDADRVTFPLVVRNPTPGECFRPLGSPGRKKISRFYNDMKIVRQQRRLYPVICSADEIVAVAGLRIDHSFRIQDATSRFLSIVWETTG